MTITDTGTNTMSVFDNMGFIDTANRLDFAVFRQPGHAANGSLSVRWRIVTLRAKANKNSRATGRA